jgi:hypothetical protein
MEADTSFGRLRSGLHGCLGSFFLAEFSLKITIRSRAQGTQWPPALHASSQAPLAPSKATSTSGTEGACRVTTHDACTSDLSARGAGCGSTVSTGRRAGCVGLASLRPAELLSSGNLVGRFSRTRASGNLGAETNAT